MDINLKCNFCGGTSFKQVLEFLPKDYPGQVFRRHTLEKCLSCGLVQLFPKPSQEELTAFYRPSYYTQNQQTDYAKKILYRSDKEKIFYFLKNSPLQIAVKLIKRVFNERTRFLRDGGRLLDIGCGNGVFLLNTARAAEKKGYKMELNGTDINIPDNPALKEHNIKLWGGGFTVGKFPPGYFDFITAHHSIEHFDNPAEIFAELYRITKNGGRLALEVPNIRSFSFALFKKYWSGIATIGHIFYFSPKTLKAYAKKAGFSVKKIRHVEEAETFVFSLLRKSGMPEERVEIWARKPCLNIIFSPFVGILNLFRAGDSIEIILAKK